MTTPVADDDLLFSTPRLMLLRCWRPADLDGYSALNTDPEVMEHLGGRPLTRAESDAFARYGEQWHDREGLGLLPVLRRSDGEFLGMCGMHRHRWYPDQVEVGWRFARHAWGHGYAAEAATRWLDHGFGPIGLDRVISITAPANTRSQAVMRRLGMRLWREDRHDRPNGPVDVVVFSVDRWRAHPPPPSTRPAAGR